MTALVAEVPLAGWAWCRVSAVGRGLGVGCPLWGAWGRLSAGVVLGQAVQWLREQQVKNVGGPVGLSGGVGLVRAVRWGGPLSEGCLVAA